MNAKTIECECGGVMKRGLAEYRFRRFEVTVPNIPALTCEKCGEVYFDGPSMEKIERRLEKKARVADKVGA